MRLPQRAKTGHRAPLGLNRRRALPVQRRRYLPQPALDTTHLARDAPASSERYASAHEAPAIPHLAARCHVRLSHSDSHIRVRRTVRLRAAATGPVRVDNRSTRLGDAPRTAAPSARPTGRGRLAPLPFNMLSPSRALHRAEKNVRRARRRTPQSACLRKNAGMSYVSTPFS